MHNRRKDSHCLAYFWTQGKFISPQRTLFFLFVSEDHSRHVTKLFWEINSAPTAYCFETGTHRNSADVNFWSIAFHVFPKTGQNVPSQIQRGSCYSPTNTPQWLAMALRVKLKIYNAYFKAFLILKFSHSFSAGLPLKLYASCTTAFFQIFKPTQSQLMSPSESHGEISRDYLLSQT